MLTIAALPGCGTFGSKSPEPSIADDLPRVRVTTNTPNSYYVFDRDNTTLVRAFADDDRTVLQFADFDTNRPQLFSSDGRELPYRAIGGYAVLPALYTKVVVRQNGRLSMISHPTLPIGTAEYPMLQEDRRLAVRQLTDPWADQVDEPRLAVRLIAGPTVINTPAYRGINDGGILVRPLPLKK
jgi:hypothetical protein